MKPYGPWKIKKRTQIYQDPWLTLYVDDVLQPDGKPSTYSIVHIKKGSSVLPLDDQGRVYLTEGFHYGVGKVTIEVCSGGSDGEETALQTAQRELKEELGITAQEWIDLGLIDPFTSSIDTPSRIFLAKKLTFGKPQLEGTETLQPYVVPLSKAVELVMNSTITDGTSCTLILKAAEYLRGKA